MSPTLTVCRRLRTKRAEAATRFPTVVATGRFDEVRSQFHSHCRRQATGGLYNQAEIERNVANWVLSRQAARSKSRRRHRPNSDPVEEITAADSVPKQAFLLYGIDLEEEKVVRGQGSVQS